MVLSDAIPERNGVGSYYRDLMGYLATHGVQMEMIPAKANCCFRAPGISFRLPGDYTQRLHVPNVARIMRRIHEHRPDVIIAPTVGPFALLALMLARRHSIRLVVGYHTAYDKLARLYWRGSRAYISSRYLEGASRLLIRAADAVAVNTPEMADEAWRFGASNVVCIGTTLACSFIQTPLAPPPRSLSNILFAGRLAAEKNLEALMDAAATCPQFQFTIAGDGPLRPALEARARALPNVHMPGWLNREQLLDKMDAADLIVLPSHIESFGSVALEGMARGRLVLVSPRCGIAAWPELAAGLYCQGENESLAAAFTRIAAASQPAIAAKSRAARLATEALNDATIGQWLDLLERKNIVRS
ncbi:MAG: glycosyltransferase [Kiritimatiellia bacterium]